jgi:hypothetical protein
MLWSRKEYCEERIMATLAFAFLVFIGLHVVIAMLKT